MKDVDRHLFSDKVKSLGIDSCLYEISKNDLIERIRSGWHKPKLRGHLTNVTQSTILSCGHRSRSPMCTVRSTSSKRRETSLGKTYNFVISGWVKPVQVLKHNSGYDSHDATSPSSFPHPPSDFCPSPFLTRVSGYHHGKMWN